jgi:hypothetical protein
VRSRLNQPDLAFDEARGILTALTNAETKAQQRLRELRAQYNPDVDPPRGTTRLRWDTLAGSHHIATAAEIEELLATLRQQLLTALEQADAITIE